MPKQLEEQFCSDLNIDDVDLGFEKRIQDLSRVPRLCWRIDPIAYALEECEQNKANVSVGLSGMSWGFQNSLGFLFRKIGQPVGLNSLRIWDPLLLVRSRSV